MIIQPLHQVILTLLLSSHLSFSRAEGKKILNIAVVFVESRYEVSIAIHFVHIVTTLCIR